MSVLQTDKIAESSAPILISPLKFICLYNWTCVKYNRMSRKDTKPLVIGCYLGLVGIVYITGIYSRDKYYFQITYIYLYSFSILKYIMQMFYTFWF